jgi:F-type H+-transporting ATPase subunit epsilon
MMMAELLDFELVSPERRLAKAKVAMVVVPGVEGDFGVLPGHAPMMSTIRPGTIEVYATEGAAPSATYEIDGGFAEVTPQGLTILAEKVS